MPVSGGDHFDLVVKGDEPGDICVLSGVSKLGVLGSSPSVKFSISGSAEVKETTRLDFNNIFAFEFLDFGRDEDFVFLVKEHSPDED